MSEDTKQLTIFMAAIVLIVLIIAVAKCQLDQTALEETKVYLEKGYHKVEGDWLL